MMGNVKERQQVWANVEMCKSIKCECSLQMIK